MVLVWEQFCQSNEIPWIEALLYTAGTVISSTQPCFVSIQSSNDEQGRFHLSRERTNGDDSEWRQLRRANGEDEQE